MTPCPRCTGPTTGDTYTCQTCTDQAHADLTATAQWLQWIDDKRARRGSTSITTWTAPPAEQPLPYDARVRHVLTPTRNTLTAWARIILDQHPHAEPPAPPERARIARLRAARNAWTIAATRADDDTKPLVRAFIATIDEDLATARTQADLTDLAQVATWLASHTGWVASREWAPTFCADAERTRVILDRLFDNPPETIALGPCRENDCTHPLAAPLGATTHRCPHCGHEHDVQQRRLDLLTQADGFTVTIREAVRLMTVMGHNVDARTIRALIRHFGIPSPWSRTVPGVTHPVPVYRLKQIREAVEQLDNDDVRRAVNRTRKGAAARGMLHASA